MFSNGRTLRLALVLTALLVVAGCAGVKHNTPSGKVEASITGASAKKVKAAITNEMINAGYRISKSDDYTIQFDKPVDNIFAAMAFGSRYDSTPSARITYSLIDLDEKTRVVADFQIVTNPGSAFERLTSANHNPSTVKYQQLLDRVKTNFESASGVPKGFSWIGLKLQEVTDGVATVVGLDKAAGAVVVSVDNDSPATKAGINRGDVITHFDGKPVQNHLSLSQAVRKAAVGRSVKVTVWRQKKSEELLLTVGRKQ